MRFGINILNFGPGTSPQSMYLWAKFAEEVGYHFVMISDHVAITPDVQAQFPAPFYDPFISLSWIAGITKKVELGTTVTILPYRHPLLTARLASNLDHISGGRFILGIGVGWAKKEFEALDVPFELRGNLTNEYLDAIKVCLTDEIANYEGRFISFKDVQMNPSLASSRRLQIWVGGSSEAALRRAVNYGDSWHPYRCRIDWLKKEALPKLRDIAELERKPVPTLCPRIPLVLTNSPLPENQRFAGQGTVDQIRADLEALKTLGAKYVLLDTYSGSPEQTLTPEKDWAMLTIMAEQVLDLEKQTLRSM